MFALDTNLLVYAHNTASEFHKQAFDFVTQILNVRDQNGHYTVCLPSQVLTEFLHVITWQRLENPLPLTEALQIVRDYTDSGIPIIHPQKTQLQTLLKLLENIKTRKKMFDVALAATLQDNHVAGLYTVNVNDFRAFDFLEIINPLNTDNLSI